MTTVASRVALPPTTMSSTTGVIVAFESCGRTIQMTTPVLTPEQREYERSRREAPDLSVELPKLTRVVQPDGAVHHILPAHTPEQQLESDRRANKAAADHRAEWSKGGALYEERAVDIARILQLLENDPDAGLGDDYNHLVDHHEGVWMNAVLRKVARHLPLTQTERNAVAHALVRCPVSHDDAPRSPPTAAEMAAFIRAEKTLGNNGD
jgi:hypothetical protein